EREIEAGEGRQPERPLQALAARRTAIGIDAEVVDELEQLDLLPLDQERRQVDRQVVVEQIGLDAELVVDGRISLVAAVDPYRRSRRQRVRPSRTVAARYASVCHGVLAQMPAR